MVSEHIIEQLKKYDACDSAIEWLKTQPSVKVAWQNCERPDWMMWCLTRKVKQGSAKHKKIVLAACDIAETVQKHIKDPKLKAASKNALKTVRLWTKGKATIEGVRIASLAAANATRAVYVVYAAAAAAANATYAVAAAACATDYPVYAEIIRKYFENPPR